MSQTKTNLGNYFEDFSVGQVLQHATPRTLTVGDAALYMGLYGSRFAVQSSEVFAKAIGYPQAPLDDLLVFHTVFGKTVPDISLNAIANLGYAECRFLDAGLSRRHAERRLRGDRPARELQPRLRRRLRAHHRAQPARRDGARVRALGDGEQARHAQPRRRRPSCRSSPSASIRRRWARRAEARLRRATISRLPARRIAGATTRVGEKIDHADAMTLEEAEHQIATRLYQNTAKVHFNLHEQAQGQFKRRLVYGGVVISLARALSFNGLANAFHIAAINGGRHVAPCFGGDTVYAWSEVLETAEIPGRSDIGALRTRLTAVKNRTCADFPLRNAKGEYADGVILDLDLWLILPR